MTAPRPSSGRSRRRAEAVGTTLEAVVCVQTTELPPHLEPARVAGSEALREALRYDNGDPSRGQESRAPVLKDAPAAHRARIPVMNETKPATMAQIAER